MSDNITAPDWKAFSLAIMKDWHEHCDVDACDKFELAKRHNIIVPIEGGFNPDIHSDTYGEAERGDPWYFLNDKGVDLVPQWQTIETAPKDGTGFLYHQSRPFGQRWVGSAVFHDGEFRHVQWEGDESDWLPVHPTHWLPLPEAPK